MVGGENKPFIEIYIKELVLANSMLVIVIYWVDATPVHKIVALFVFADNPKHGSFPDIGSWLLVERSLVHCKVAGN